MVRRIASHADFAVLKTGCMAVDVIEHFKKNDASWRGSFPP